jgi:hypothetical protein
MEQLEVLSAGEIPAADFGEKPKNFDRYMEILGGQKFTMGPCFLIPPPGVCCASRTKPQKAGNSLQAVPITADTIGDYSREGFEWLIDEIAAVQPCMACIREGRIVSQCRSVRISPRAHEAGLETLEPFRGQGLASLVTAGWAQAVREMGALPLYSTSWKNTASQQVAQKMALYHYGNVFSVF